MKAVTLIFLLRDDEILLAMKKRSYGKGRWNGAGGKAEPGESAVQTAIRECQEEVGIIPTNPRYVGRIKFYEQDDPSFGNDCRIFTATEWEGEPIETEEMRPRWFKIRDIPYDQMWPDDKIWLPILLEGELFEGTVTVTADRGAKLVSYDIKRVKQLKQSA